MVASPMYLQAEPTADRRPGANRWQVVFDTLRTPVFLLDGKGREVWSNRAAADLKTANASLEDTAIPLERFLRQWAGDGIGPKASEVTWAGHRYRVTLDPLPFVDDLLNERDDGFRPVRVCVFTDVTEQRRTQAALRESEERNRLLSEHLDVAFFIFSPHAERVLFVSPAYERIWGHSCRSLYERPQSWLEAVHPLDLPRVLAFHRPPFVGVLGGSDAGVPLPRAARAPARIEYRVQRPDGTVRWVWASTFPLRDADGRTDRVAVLVHDVTEQKQFESQLLRSQRLESIGTLAGGIAHDLNNVLTPIGLGVDLLHEVTDPIQQHALLTTLRASVDRGGALIQQILAFARGQDGERRPLALRRIVLETTQILQHTLPKSIHIETDLSTGLWNVAGDATQLNQVVLNLCVNARDAMPHGGRLTLSAVNRLLNEEAVRKHPDARPGRYVLLSVADTGMGIAPETLDRIFDPFFTTKAVGQGTGLGLSTVRGIVHGHGGFLDVESKVGHGTQFHIYLPAAEGVGEAGSRGEERLLPTGRGELVLVIDDESSIRELATATLEAFGYRTLCAADGSEGVALYVLHQDEVALMLVDMMMPVMDGPTTMKAVRTINPEVRLLAASGLTTPNPDDYAEGQTPLFLPKPYSAEQLLEAVRLVLAQGARETASGN